MSRKTLIILLVVLAGLIGLIVAGVMLLYSGTDTARAETEVPDSQQYLLMPAVPVDAVMVGAFSNVEAVLPKILPATGFAASLNELVESQAVVIEQMVVSLHNLGRIYPLYIIDAGVAQNETTALAMSVLAAAEDNGLYAEYFNCSTLDTPRKIAGRSIVLASPYKELVLSSKRHLRASESVLKAPGFYYAHAKSKGENRIFLSNVLSEHLVSSVFSNRLRSFFTVGKRMSDWISLEVESLSDVADKFSGSLVSDQKQPDILTVFDGCGMSASEVSEMLPSYTVSAFALPIKKRTEFLNSYQTYLDSRQGLQRKLILRKRLEDANGLSPEDFCERLDVAEVATASFKVNDGLQRVNLVRVGKVDKNLISLTTGLNEYKYASYIGSLFGDLFILEDESHYTYINGWIVSGSKDAVQLYVSGEATFYNLSEYMLNADVQDMFTTPAAFMAYVSYTLEPDLMGKIFQKAVQEVIATTCEGVDYSGAFMTLGENGDVGKLRLEMFRKEIKRSKAPMQARDTMIVISKGPFSVKNARTGMTNQFYQSASNNYLCLKDENGKGVWGVPFDKPICGTAQSIDYLGNNKFQILFGAGTKLHLIDVLGRFVADFSADLGKDILLGPDVYDFSGSRKYNVMVLHKDNTIEMYNLKGERPASWSTITSADMIKGLPEKIDLGGNTFWIVRTAIQTLIYPFGGGNPVSTLTGDQMALPHTEVKVLDETSVEVECYDGKHRTIKLK